jgi:alpha/beta superfamily hydrolase
MGTLHVSVDLRIVFHISADGKGGLISSADSPDQSAYGLKCDSTYIADNELVIEMEMLQASYRGKMINDSTIAGIFVQQVSIPLTLTKTDKLAERKRPQTPKPPFSYREEEVIYNNQDKSISYGATITIPEGKGPFPAILFITGSGPQDRDETIMEHKPFAVLADHLTKNGYIVLRVDDRGIGKTTGNFKTATSADFANDVSNGIDYLLSRPEVNKKKIGLLGHSEGGMIAPMVAEKRKEIDFLVLLAGPGVRIIDLMSEQNAAIARASGVSEEAVKQIKPLFTKVVETIMQSPDSLTAHQQVTAYTEYWASTQPAAILKELDFQTQENRSNYIASMITEFNSPWFRYFMAFDPSRYLTKLHAIVLALNGDRDIQVLSSQNLPGIEAALKKSKSKDYEIKELKGLNHLFQECKTCTIQEYGELEQTISPLVLETITTWLDKHVK